MRCVVYIHSFPTSSRTQEATKKTLPLPAGVGSGGAHRQLRTAALLEGLLFTCYKLQSGSSTTSGSNKKSPPAQERGRGSMRKRCPCEARQGNVGDVPTTAPQPRRRGGKPQPRPRPWWNIPPPLPCLATLPCLASPGSLTHDGGVRTHDGGVVRTHTAGTKSRTPCQLS